ncbi:Inner membrane transport permease YbhR [Corynebacterium occultum]|uniref:Transport permease protein n=1 Tax=Corynebacterium occultum TaxID=2675219 RepID=A0A6B8VW37_9CORY|nr:ABC transporter permease [Corynebacterium occultum]QGU07349.1 Inner membrane transport permease YbhR [Corynebacterium occultum]
MNPGLTIATMRRVLAQLRADPRSVALILLVPLGLMVLLYYLYSGDPGREQLFHMIATVMVAVFPLTLMFSITSVTMQRERAGGTLERLWTTRIHRIDLILGYALAFGLMVVAQAIPLFILSRHILDVDSEAPWWITLLISVATGLIGVALGLLSSAFARTEFQAVQSLSLLIIPQVLLCGLLVPREEMHQVLQGISDLMPLSYSVDAALVSSREGATAEVLTKTLICLGFVAAFLGLAAATMPRRAH